MHSGYFYPSKTFINRVKRFFGPNTKVSIQKYDNKWLVSDLFSVYEDEITPGTTRFYRDQTIPLNRSKFKLIISDKKTKIVMRFSEKNCDWATLSYDGPTKFVHKNPLTVRTIDFSNRYNQNKNILRYVGFKAAYSKKLFEQFLKEKPVNGFDLTEKVLYL